MLVAKAPLRIGLFGGACDFESFFSKNEANVINVAIDKFIYCILHPRADKKTYVGYSKQEICDNWREIQHPLVRACFEFFSQTLGMEDVGLELKFVSDIPYSNGSGLGSSSAFTASCLTALASFCNMAWSAEELAQTTCHVEITLAKSPIGIQDQLATSFGGMRHYKMLGKEAKNAMLPREWLWLRPHLALFDLDIPRKENPLGEQEKRNNAGLNELSLFRINNIAKRAVLAMQGQNVKELAACFDDHWDSKKSLSGGVTNKEIDAIVEKVQSCGCAAKVSGAGGGGYLLVFGEPDKLLAVSEKLGIRPVQWDACWHGGRVVFAP